MFTKPSSLISILLAICLGTPCNQLLAWSEAGHHLIAQLAFSKLEQKDRDRLIEIVKKHPRFAEDFKRPAKVSDEDYNSWLIGRAAFWPDVARKSEYDRPNWHYQLGSSLNVGSVDGINVPSDPIKLPSGATLQSKDLHIVQAFNLCLKLFRAKDTSDQDRAVALCWILHLAGDAHQPCHAGALYQKDLFPNGDRGGNSIPTVQSKNLHALWDGLLGPRYNAGDIKRRIVEVEESPTRRKSSPPIDVVLSRLDCAEWIKEGREIAKLYVYSPEVTEWISVAVRSKTAKPQQLKLPDWYLKNAGEAARFNAYLASMRLSRVLSSNQ